MKCYREPSTALQLDLLDASGLEVAPATRPMLDNVERLAQALDRQGRPEVPIAIRQRQERELAQTLHVDGRPLMFGSHLLRVVR